MVTGQHCMTPTLLLAPTVNMPVWVAAAAAAAAANKVHVLGKMSEKPAVHAVQTPSAEQVAQLREQGAQVPAHGEW
jgi:hypothetical protein